MDDDLTPHDLYRGDALNQTERLLSVWAADRTESTVERLGGLARQFATGLAARQLGLHDADIDDIDRYVWAQTRRATAPSPSTVLLRRNAVSNLYRTAREIDPGFPDPTAALSLPGKTVVGVRPTIDDEQALIRTAALGRPRGALAAAAAIALCEATATTGELGRIEWTDVDIDAACVRLPGATPVIARVGRLTDWGCGVLSRLSKEATTVTVIPYTRQATTVSPYAGQAAMTSLISHVIAASGIDRHNIEPRSIRLWGGQQAFARGGIEAAALALGFRSLDTAAEQLGYRWSR